VIYESEQTSQIETRTQRSGRGQLPATERLRKLSGNFPAGEADAGS
jgi:hypothetical protein